MTPDSQQKVERSFEQQQSYQDEHRLGQTVLLIDKYHHVFPRGLVCQAKTEHDPRQLASEREGVGGG